MAAMAKTFSFCSFVYGILSCILVCEAGEYCGDIYYRIYCSDGKYCCHPDEPQCCGIDLETHDDDESESLSTGDIVLITVSVATIVIFIAIAIIKCRKIRSSPGGVIHHVSPDNPGPTNAHHPPPTNLEVTDLTIPQDMTNIVEVAPRNVVYPSSNLASPNYIYATASSANFAPIDNFELASAPPMEPPPYTEYPSKSRPPAYTEFQS